VEPLEPLKHLEPLKLKQSDNDLNGAKRLNVLNIDIS